MSHEYKCICRLSVLACSTTYFDDAYPLLIAALGSEITVSGTGPERGSEPCATLTEDVNNNFGECFAARQKSINLRVPVIWASNDASEWLKLTFQALCTMCVNELWSCVQAY